MITLLIGENSFEVEQVITRVVDDFDGQVERIEGATLASRDLPDLLMATTLFASHRLVIIRNVSENKTIWGELAEWLPRVSDDIHVIFVEPKPDKRTKTYKALQAIATVQEYKLWNERDERTAERWVQQQAAQLNMTMTPGLSQLLVERVGFDQWQLVSALEKLSVFDVVTEDAIRQTIEARPIENIFELFEAALSGDQQRVQHMVATLALSEDPYLLFGLLSGQAFQLTALTFARGDSDVARDFSVHPFVLSRLRTHASSKSAGDARALLMIFAEADEVMKTTPVDPWVAIERTLLKVASN